MKKILTIISTALVLQSVFTPVYAYEDDDDIILLAEQWEISRNGAALSQLSEIKRAIRQWSSAPNQIIELHYPGGEEGELWAGELINWLVSLGIPSSDLATVPGSLSEDAIRLLVIKNGESYR